MTGWKEMPVGARCLEKQVIGEDDDIIRMIGCQFKLIFSCLSASKRVGRLAELPNIPRFYIKNIYGVRSTRKQI